MATENVDTLTGLVWDVNDSWDTLAQTGGEILPIKEEEEEGKSKYGIIWDIDKAWVSMYLAGDETLTTQDKDDNSERVDEGEKGATNQ